MDLNRILREGFIAGCIGAAAVAIWFLVVDAINGQALFTPAMLGSAVFWGAHDSASVVIEPARIFGYTMIHVSRSSWWAVSPPRSPLRWSTPRPPSFSSSSDSASSR